MTSFSILLLSLIRICLQLDTILLMYDVEKDCNTAIAISKQNVMFRTGFLCTDVTCMEFST